MVNYLGVTSKISTQAGTEGAAAVAELVLEVLQGPCEVNQEYFCKESPLLEILNRMMRSKTRNDQVEEDTLDLKVTVVKIFQALLEGRSVESELYAKIVGIVHLDVLQSYVQRDLVTESEQGEEGDADSKDGDSKDGERGPDGELNELQSS